LNGTHQILVYADNTDTLGENITKRTTEGLFDDSREVGLEVNTERNKRMVMSRLQNAAQKHSL
jgi:hypothetical protein